MTSLAIGQYSNFNKCHSENQNIKYIILICGTDRKKAERKISSKYDHLHPCPAKMEYMTANT